MFLRCFFISHKPSKNDKYSLTYSLVGLIIIDVVIINFIYFFNKKLDIHDVRIPQFIQWI